MYLKDRNTSVPAIFQEPNLEYSMLNQSCMSQFDQCCSVVSKDSTLNSILYGLHKPDITC